MWDASGPAFSRACSTPVSEISMSVTSQPCFASQIECRPAPPARSSALPPWGNRGRTYSENARGKNGSGALDGDPTGSTRYFWFQRSRSASESASELEEAENGMLIDSNQVGSSLRDSNGGDAQLGLRSDPWGCPPGRPSQRATLATPAPPPPPPPPAVPARGRPRPRRRPAPPLPPPFPLFAYRS